MSQSVVIEGRIPLTTIATLARYFEESGTPAGSKSDLLWKGVELLTRMLVHNEKVTAFTDVEEAFNFMSGRFGTLNRSGRGLRSLQMELQRSALEKDGFNPAYATEVKTKITQMSDAELQAIVREQADKLSAKPIINE